MLAEESQFQITFRKVLLGGKEVVFDSEDMV